MPTKMQLNKLEGRIRLAALQHSSLPELLHELECHCLSTSGGNMAKTMGELNALQGRQVSEKGLLS